MMSAKCSDFLTASPLIRLWGSFILPYEIHATSLTKSAFPEHPPPPVRTSYLEAPLHLLKRECRLPDALHLRPLHGLGLLDDLENLLVLVGRHRVGLPPLVQVGRLHRPTRLKPEGHEQEDCEEKSVQTPQLFGSVWLLEITCSSPRFAHFGSS